LEKLLEFLWLLANFKRFFEENGEFLPEFVQKDCGFNKEKEGI